MMVVLAGAVVVVVVVACVQVHLQVFFLDVFLDFLFDVHLYRCLIEDSADVWHDSTMDPVVDYHDHTYFVLHR